MRGLQVAGIGTETVLRCSAVPTASYTAVLDPRGELLVGLADMQIYERLEPGIVMSLLGKISRLPFLFIDANLAAETVLAVAEAARSTRVVAGATSPAKASRLAAALPLIDVLFCNQAEAAALCGRVVSNRTDALNATVSLRDKGVRSAFVTMGSDGVAAAGEGFLELVDVPAHAVADANGAGDGFAAGVIDGLAQGDGARDAIFRGLALARMTADVEGATNPNLSGAALTLELERIQPVYESDRDSH